MDLRSPQKGRTLLTGTWPNGKDSGNYYIVQCLGAGSPDKLGSILRSPILRFSTCWTHDPRNLIGIRGCAEVGEQDPNLLQPAS